MSLTGGPPLRSNLAQSTSELQAFVKSLKGKTPAEAMGTVAQSQLLKMLILSLVLQGVIFLALTLPFAWTAKPAPASADEGKTDVKLQGGKAPAATVATSPALPAPATGNSAGSTTPAASGGAAPKTELDGGPTSRPTAPSKNGLESIDRLE